MASYSGEEKSWGVGGGGAGLHWSRRKARRRRVGGYIHSWRRILTREAERGGGGDRLTSYP